MKRISLVSVVLLIVMTMSVVGFTAEPIKFGAVNPLGDITGFQTTRAMELAIKEINEAGGLLGRPVELIVVDDEMRPEIGAAAIDRLATVDHVDFFVAHVPRTKQNKGKFGYFAGLKGKDKQIYPAPRAVVFYAKPRYENQGEAEAARKQRAESRG